MGERASCPVCGSCSSNVLNDIQSGFNCRICGCLNELLQQYQYILNKKEDYIDKKISKHILDENDKLIKENMFLKTKLSKLIEIVGYEFDSPIINTFTQILKIIHEE